ncbi:MAG: haloacid dehalogenase [Actinobacteria bacterium 69-20]|nr:HAD family phosphatase [Actinomycetota bacterium]OJV29550.1 MAG: haloacid dehalogenase [Actinobacteria bacterium 69-20]
MNKFATPTASSSARAVAAVVFDYGGVMTTPMRGSINAGLVHDGIDRISFTTALRSWLSRSAPNGTPIHRLETGELDPVEFEHLLAAELRSLDGSPVDPAGLLRRLFAQMTPEPTMFKLVADLRAAGVRVALLSNSWGNAYPREELDVMFDAVVISAEVGLRKPQPAIYRIVLDRLGLPAAGAVFIDDAEPNLIGAAEVGLDTLLHTSATVTRSLLARHIPALDSTVDAARPEDGLTGTVATTIRSPRPDHGRPTAATTS